MLTASVLDIAQIQQIKESGWDIAYKHEDQLFELFGSELIRGGKGLEFQILYNPETVILLDTRTQTGFSSSTYIQSWVYKVSLSNYWEFALDQNLFQVKFDGLEKDILLWDAYFLDQDGNKKALKVWNLSIKKSQDSHGN